MTEAWALAVKTLSGECHRTSQIRSQHWFKYGLLPLGNRPLTEPILTRSLSPHGATRPHWVNHCHAEFVLENKYMFFFLFSIIFNTQRSQAVPILSHGGKDLFVSHGQYHGTWWLNGASHQGISSHDIKIIILNYSSFSTIGFKSFFKLVKKSLWRPNMGCFSEFKFQPFIMCIHSNMYVITMMSNDCHGVSNQQKLCHLFNMLFNLTTKKIPLLCITGPMLMEYTSHWLVPLTKGQYFQNILLSMSWHYHIMLWNSIHNV